MSLTALERPQPPSVGRPGGTKRRAILDGAERVFLRFGYEASSMDAVAAAAGVSKVTLYRYFPTKTELFAGVVEQLRERMVAEGIDSVDAQAEPRTALRAFARRYITVMLSEQNVGLFRMVMAEVSRFPDLGRAFYQSGPQAAVRAVEDYLRAHRHHADCRGVVRPEAAARDFLALLKDIVHPRLLFGWDVMPRRSEIDARIEAALRLALRLPEREADAVRTSRS